MKIRIRHATTYHYENPGSHLVQRLYLTPQDTASQSVLDWTIEAPGMEGALEYVDAYGNVAHVTTPPIDLAEVTVIAAGTVRTADTAGVTGHGAGSVPIQAYLASTPATEASAAIKALAQAQDHLSGLEQLHSLSAAVLAKVDYAIGATDEHTSAADAMREGKGVCQDHAHVFISAARVLGVPARYVSGYMVVGENELAEASHAWAEAHVDNLGWVGFDVSNQLSPDERYVRVAVGMDVSGATPAKGVRRGLSASAERMDVEVLVESIAEQ
ncbi:MAG: transglutaminase family protein [Anderseniella sp.]